MSFRVFGWLLVREAYIRVRHPHLAELPHGYTRGEVAGSPSHVLRRRAERIIVLNEARRYYP